jgi:hypothetical protein
MWDKQIQGGMKMTTKTKVTIGVRQFAYWKNI